MALEHEQMIEKIRNTHVEPRQTSSHVVAWMSEQLSRSGASEIIKGTIRKRQLIEDCRKQQEELQRKIDEAIGEEEEPDVMDTLRDALKEKSKPKTDQELLIEQVRTALAPKSTERDPNKALLKALITAQNKTQGVSGTSMLKPDVLNKLKDTEFSMAEWLASLNK